MNKRCILLWVIMSTLSCVSHAEEYIGAAPGRWALKKIVVVANTHIKPILKQGNTLEITNSEFTLLAYAQGEKIDLNKIPFCHPEFSNGEKFSLDNDESLKGFIQSAGGLSTVNHILKKKLHLTLADLEFTWSMNENTDGIEPCKALSESDFYITSDLKSVLIFRYPYIYDFSGNSIELYTH